MPSITNNPIFKLVKFTRENFGGYIPTIFLLALLSFLSSLTEAIGINAVIPLFSFVNGGGGDTSDTISQLTRHFFEALHVPYTFRFVFGMIIVLFAVKTVVLFVSQYISLETQFNYEKDMREDLLKTTLNGDWMYVSKQKIGHLEQMLTFNVEKCSSFLIEISNLVLILANLAVYSLLSVNISISITLLTFVFGIIIFYGFRPLFRRNRAASEVSLIEYRSLAHFINETILGLKLVKASSVEGKIAQKASENFKKLRELRLRVGLLSALSTAILQPLPLFFIMGIFAFFYKTGGFSFASFAVVIYAINRVFSNFQSLQAEIHKMVAYLPYLDSIRTYKLEAAQHREVDEGTKEFAFKQKLTFKDVSFAYPAGNDVVSDMDFSISRGELVGVIGPSGAGKTTVVDLMLRLLKPQSGVIMLDDTEISNIKLTQWRENVGYVSQDVFLFNDTIASNIRFYNGKLTDADIVESAKLANIHEFITQQPEGYDTIVGERGLKLSGGQRQRVALARILARKPQILILDEATSALDNESEVVVHAAILGLKRKITVIVIAHRLSTVVDTDRLIVLEKGRVIEEGTPEKLLQDKESYFSRVYNLRK